MGGARIVDVEVERFWDLWQRGASLRGVARLTGRDQWSVRQVIGSAGGIRPPTPRRDQRHLTFEEREEISRGLAADESFQQIGERLGRSRVTVWREVSRNGGREGYRAAAADAAAGERARRPKPGKLEASPLLAELVEEKLQLRWAPAQIAGWLRRTYPDKPELWVSHETIYRTLFIQARGSLKKELTAHLRTRRTMRRPKGSSQHHGQGRGSIRDQVHISQRPPEADDRAVPGHWEGDLLLGSGRSAIATLVERASRYVMLVKVEGMKTSQVVPALTEQVQTLPVQLRRSLAWDQGKEMADHVRFTIDTGVQVYFCDPASPWQRGSNENTNGLLRQYFPKGTSLKTLTQAELDAVAAELNGRPRKTLQFMTPSEALADLVAPTP